MNQFSNRATRRAASAREGVPMTRGANVPHEEVYRGFERDVYREKRAAGVRVRKGGAASRKWKGEIVRRYMMRVGGKA